MRDNFTLWKEKPTFVWASQWECPKNWRDLLEQKIPAISDLSVVFFVNEDKAFLHAPGYEPDRQLIKSGQWIVINGSNIKVMDDDEFKVTYDLCKNGIIIVE